MFADPYSSNPTPLGNALIEFRIQDSKITVRVEGDQIYLNGGQSLVLTPHASNAIYVGLKKW